MATSTSTRKTKTGLTYSLRPATLSDSLPMALIATKVYTNDPLDAFLSPHRFQHWNHFIRSYHNKIVSRVLDPRNLSIVAVVNTLPPLLSLNSKLENERRYGKKEEESRGRIVGYSQSVRLGNDEGAKEQLERRWTLLLFLQAWYFYVIYVLQSLISPNRAEDATACATFSKWMDEADKKYWEGERRWGERWHTQSVCVAEEFQGMGIGKALMEGVLEKAKGERVPVGIEASVEGRRMYERCGFEFRGSIGWGIGEEEGGGIMVWLPEERKKEEEG